MTDAEKWIVESAKKLVSAWVNARRNTMLHQDAQRAFVTNTQDLIGCMVATQDYTESLAKVVMCEVELSHAVMRLEKSKEG